MSNTAEINFAIQNDRPSIMIRLTAQEEGDSKPDLRGLLSQIQEAISGFQLMPPVNLLPGSEVDVHDLSDTAMDSINGSSVFNGTQTSSTKSCSSRTCNEPKITKSQIFLLRKTLRGLNRTDTDFCQQYQISHIEDLSKEDARWIIRDLRETERR